MYIEERHQAILDWLTKKGSIANADIQEQFGVSYDSAKRDLRILEEKGKSKYWLYKQLGMSYQNFSKMVNNETKSIRYENIETMCLLLGCTPNDLLVISEDE